MSNTFDTKAREVVWNALDFSDVNTYEEVLEQAIPRLETALTALSKAHEEECLRILSVFEKDCKLNYTTFGNSEKMLQVSGVFKRIESERNRLLNKGGSDE